MCIRDRVNAEAQQAAEAVFKKYDAKFKSLVEGQLKREQELYLVNGGSYIKGIGYSEGEVPPTEACDRFMTVVAQVQYLKQRASFNVYEFKN
jgi:hypothetical protein